MSKWAFLLVFAPVAAMAGAVSFIFSTEKGVDFGGMTTSAVLISVTKNAKTGKFGGHLAEKGNVYVLVCE